MRKQKAFTLVELLVAMAIIGVLLGLAIFGLSSAQRAQRDTERRAALQDINIGMQTYYETYNRYPQIIEINNENQVRFCNVAACNDDVVTVPLKGAAVSDGNSIARNLNQANIVSQADGTVYCLASADYVEPPANSGNPDGYVFCAKLENNSVFCVGAGAVTRNIITSCGNYQIQ